MPKSIYHWKRALIHSLYLSAACSGRQKYSISICSNSRVRKVKLPGVISLRNDLPVWAIPKGSLRCVESITLRKLTKMPWAVSGLKKTTDEESSMAPTLVLSIRLNARGSVSSDPLHLGHLPFL